MASASVQDYLVTIYRLQAGGTQVTTTALAGQLGVAPASITEMARKLHAQGLVVHVPYRGLALTEAGEVQALRLLRRHRLWELFLTEVLGLPWDEVHQEAHRLEHATSERVAERLAAYLDQPDSDPHGQPIPARDGTLPRRATRPLAGVGAGQALRVVEVPDGDPDLLRQLAGWGLVPGTRTVVLASGAEQAIRLQVGDQQPVLSRGAASAIQVLLE